MARKSVSVYLALGSNIGNRRKNLKNALRFLAEKTHIDNLSSVYDTAPVYNEDQPRFLNMVCQISTRLSPKELLAFVKEIEQRMGRLPKTHNLPRPIDIDILFYSNQVIQTPDLTVPHALLHERAFVLVPLAEISPNLIHPVNKITVKTLLRSVNKGGIILSGKLEV